ncbi:pyrimidine 5-nucleotidase [Lentinus tigrinus ALCF2SS1-7]|uniref:Pyrimidine 5-nucleotidase n=1 Tax=Lentinus tigrinus ALCF2SS1-6 TaxID=1328759 RepID=A0A5C2SW85_9APHY|nr:pyrimidine 5-nucleotidase [Lentinus tigrinus ALCF2SS1-6]RPD81159.1 pyrimidine 5-nucleotidase [Lentinus tigrinus ALCF2SS1-7]
MGVPQDEKDERCIVWLDIDNTLYSASAGISHAMGERIHAYFVGMGLPDEEASKLHHRYYSQYGLAIRGLVRHHEIDPLDFDRKCDGSLPLEELLKPDPVLRKLLQDIDRSKVRVWALTNAYYTHANRVLRILGVDDLIEGVVFCDYSDPEFNCKPEPEFYHNAMRVANVTEPEKCYFVDDSLANIKAARKLGWGHCVHFCERGLLHVEGGKPKYIGSDVKEGPDTEGIAAITKVDELRTVWPEIFKH